MLDMKNFEIDENELDKVCGGDATVVELVEYEGNVYDNGILADGLYVEYFRGNDVVISTFHEYCQFKNSEVSKGNILSENALDDLINFHEYNAGKRVPRNNVKDVWREAKPLNN